MIQYLLDSGKKFSSGRLTIYQDKDIPGLKDEYAGAYLVPKSAGTAVERNRIKRWLREDLREFQREFSFKGGIVIRFKGMVKEINHTLLKEDLRQLINSMGQDA